MSDEVDEPVITDPVKLAKWIKANPIRAELDAEGYPRLPPSFHITELELIVCALLALPRAR